MTPMTSASVRGKAIDRVAARQRRRFAGCYRQSLYMMAAFYTISHVVQITFYLISYIPLFGFAIWGLECGARWGDGGSGITTLRT
jgi:hypothetical protein